MAQEKIKQKNTKNNQQKVATSAAFFHNKKGNEMKNKTIPENEKALAKFIADRTKELAKVQKSMNQPNLPEDHYKQLHEKTRELAGLKLEAECRLGAIIRELPKAQGKRTDRPAATDKPKSKKEIIRERFDLTPTQAKQIAKLTKESVRKAISRAKKTKEIPTRALAISIIKEKINNENKKEFPCKNVFADVRPDIDKDFTKFLSQLKATSLFACGGIGTALLHKLWVQVSVGSELLKHRADFHQLLHKDCKMIVGDINDKVEEIAKQHRENGCKVIVATPPCQDFTPLNSNRAFDTNVERSALFVPMLDVLRQVNDVNEYFILENVKEYLEASPRHLQDILKGKTIVEYIVSELECMGYQTNWSILDASFYGVCQSRKRLIITAAKTDIWKLPAPDTFRKMLWEVIGDLPSLKNGEVSALPWHWAAKLPDCQVACLAKTPTGRKIVGPCKADGTPFKGQKERKARNSWEIAGTIKTDNGEVLGDRTIAPGRKLPDGTYSDCRCFSILELLKITGLTPDDFPIPTTTSERLIRELLGEALMPTLLNRIFETIPMSIKSTNGKKLKK